MKLKSRLLVLFSVLVSLLLATCAQYRGRVVTLHFISKGDENEGSASGIGDFYANMSRRFSGSVVFKDVKETDTLRDVFTRAAVANGWNPETDGIGPWTWVPKDGSTPGEDAMVTGADGFVQTWMGSNPKDRKYGFSVTINQDHDKRKYSTDWNKNERVDNLSNLRFYKDTPFNVFTTGIDEKLGDCISVYPKYDMSFSESLGEFYLLTWRNILDDVTGEPSDELAPAVFLQSYTIDSNATSSEYVFESLVDGLSPVQYARLNGPDGMATGFVKYTVDRVNDSGVVIEKGVFRNKEEFEKAIRIPSPDANGDEGTYPKQLHYVMNSHYKDLPDKPVNFARATKEMGFVYKKIARNVDGSIKEYAINQISEPSAAITSYPVYRAANDQPVASISADDINESNGQYFYLFNGLVSKKSVMASHGATEWSDDEFKAEYDELASKYGAEEYYVLEPAAVGEKQTEGNMINPLVASKLLNYYPELVVGGVLSPNGFKFEKNDDGSLRTICPGDVFMRDEIAVEGSKKSLSGRILVPKYIMPTAVVEVNYNVSVTDPDTTKGGVGIDGDKGWVADANDPAIDGKGYPIVQPKTAEIIVRAGETLAGARKKLLEIITDDPSERKNPDRIWWPMDVDPLSYLIESKLYDNFYGLQPISLQIIDYNKNPDDCASGASYYLDGTDNTDNISDIKKHDVFNYLEMIDVSRDGYKFYDGVSAFISKDQHLSYRTYDFARELLYGYRDYKNHGKRYFFDLRRQGMARDDDNAAGGGGEWEIRGDAPELPAGYWIDNKAVLGASDLPADSYARPVKGDMYQIFGDISIRPFYIEAGYAPIARKLANVVPEAVAYGETSAEPNMNERRRVDIFANFIYVPGSSAGRYPAPAAVDTLPEARKKWGIAPGQDYAVVTGDVSMSLGQTVVLDARDDGSASSSKLMPSLEVMEIPMTYALMYSLGKDQWNQEQLDTIHEALNGDVYRKPYAAVVNSSPRVDAWSVLPIELNPVDWVLGGNNSMSDGAGIRYRIAKQLCNLMTDNYNTAYNENLSKAYDETNNYKPVRNATGFRLPTRDEYDYIQRIVTQRQQIVPRYKEYTLSGKKYYAEKREVPYGGDNGDSYDGAYQVLAWKDSKDTGNGISKVNAFIAHNDSYDYDFQSSLSLPGMKLKNYDRDYDNSDTVFGNTDISKELGGVTRDMFSVTTTRFEYASEDYGQWFDPETPFYPSAKRTLNVRSGSGVMDFESAMYLLEPETGNNDLLTTLFRDYRSKDFFSGGYDTVYRKINGKYVFSKQPTAMDYDPIASSASDDVEFRDKKSGGDGSADRDREYDPDTGVAMDTLLLSGHNPMRHPYFSTFADLYDNVVGRYVDPAGVSGIDLYYSVDAITRMKGNYYIGRPLLGDASNYQYLNFRAVRTMPNN